MARPAGRWCRLKTKGPKDQKDRVTGLGMPNTNGLYAAVQRSCSKRLSLLNDISGQTGTQYMSKCAWHDGHTRLSITKMP